MKDRGRTAFWFLLVSGLITFAMAMGYRWLERGGAFDLDTVWIRGIRHADSSAVSEIVKPLFGISIWQLDPSSIQSKLSAVPGIDSASVSRLPFRGLLLEISLSEPVFAISDSSGTAAVSSLGEILPERFLIDSIPVIESNEKIGSVFSRRFALWLRSGELPCDSLLFRYTGRGLSVIVNNGYEVLLGFDHFSERWDSYRQLVSSLSGYDNLGQVDMRYSNQAVLRTLADNASIRGNEL